MQPLKTPTGKRFTLPRATRSEMLQFSPVEARGIEPRSRSTSVLASTCVACQFPTRLPVTGSRRVCWTGFRQAGFRDNYRPGRFNVNGRRGGSSCPNPQVHASLTCVRTGTSQAKLPGRPAGLTPRGSTAVQQLMCHRLFTWPTDEPRHATMHFHCPVETNSPPGDHR